MNHIENKEGTPTEICTLIFDICVLKKVTNQFYARN